MRVGKHSCPLDLQFSCLWVEIILLYFPYHLLFRDSHGCPPARGRGGKGSSEAVTQEDDGSDTWNFCNKF